MRKLIVVSVMSLLLFLEFVVIYFGWTLTNHAAPTASSSNATAPSQQNRNIRETEWVAAHLNGHHYEGGGVVDGVKQTSTESVSATIDDACSLKLKDETQMHLSTAGLEDVRIAMDCTVDLRTFPRGGITLEPQPTGDAVPNEWIVDLDDNDAVDCVESNNAITKTEKNEEFHLFFHSKAEADQMIEGFRSTLIDSCHARREQAFKITPE